MKTTNDKSDNRMIKTTEKNNTTTKTTLRTTAK